MGMMEKQDCDNGHESNSNMNNKNKTTATQNLLRGTARNHDKSE